MQVAFEMSVSDLLDRYEARYVRSVNLVASENLASPAVRRALASDLAMRYCLPPEGKRPPEIWDYPNQDDPRAIATLTEDLACALFGAAYADVRPLSGNQVAQIVLMYLVRRGETVWSVPGDCGGHFTTRVVAAREGLDLVDLPYDRQRGVIDIERVRDLARVRPPKLVFLDASMQTFPHPVRELREAIGPDAIISYDASHTMGLIAGKAFQDPLAEGADLLHGSTHKTLWGPQKGLIMVRDLGALSDAIHRAVVPMFVSNAHVHHIAALGVALEEARDFGQAYAAAVIANARALAAGLGARGVDVLFLEYGGTQSHQVLVDLGEKAPALELWRGLQSAGINTNAVSLPFRTGQYGLRIGVAEPTRRGMGPAEMSTIAAIMAAILVEGREPGPFADEIAALSGCFTGIAFAQALPVVAH